MELRKFLYGAEHPVAAGSAEISMSDFMEMGGEKGVDMAEPLSDFSKIVELQEIKKLYDEARDRHGRELGEKDETIQHLEEDLRSRNEEVTQMKGQVHALTQEREKLKQQLAFTKNELEQKIQRLQERIQQLTGPATPIPSSVGDKKSGFFKK
jgi:uncharacterized protein with von Willebrand factor type A (vWA) domain